MPKKSATKKPEARRGRMFLCGICLKPKESNTGKCVPSNGPEARTPLLRESHRTRKQAIHPKKKRYRLCRSMGCLKPRRSHLLSIVLYFQSTGKGRSVLGEFCAVDFRVFLTVSLLHQRSGLGKSLLLGFAICDNRGVCHSPLKQWSHCHPT